MDVLAVESFMTKKVVCVGLDSPVTEVLNKLRAYHISCVLVCEDETPVGMISERDIVGLQKAQLKAWKGADASAEEAAARMPEEAAAAESGVDNVRILARDLLWLRVALAPEPLSWPDEVQIDLRAVGLGIPTTSLCSADSIRSLESGEGT